jgi:ABC-type Mn2+/Zn2+ transport system permease subunit
MATTAKPRNKIALLEPALLFYGEDEVGSAQVPLLKDDMEAQLPNDTASKQALPLPMFWIGLLMGFMEHNLAMAMMLFLQSSNVFVGQHSLTTALISTVIMSLFLWVVWRKHEWCTNDQATAVERGSSDDFLRFFVGAGCGIFVAWTQALAFVMLTSL